jgi:uncharacterized protein
LAENDALFLDTAYVYALYNTRDQWHEKALEWERKIAAENRSLVTTQFVLTEIANGLSSLKFRRSAVAIVYALQESDLVEVIPASSELFAKALKLYEQRQDKSWGLTDCTSFVVMKENELTDALTTDEHFRQAGFKVLLLD